MGTYSVILTCRDSEENIASTLNSLIDQTIKAEYIIVIDDGSKDNTPKILKTIQSRNNNLYIITNPDMGYNIGRVVQNWNKALRLAKELNLKLVDYHMISADDNEYERDYCEKIIRNMDSDPYIAIASGNFDDNEYATPHGAGRFIRNSFFSNIHGYYPEKMGYESVIFFSALENNFKYKIIKEARFLHTRKLGSIHGFYEFGASMRTLGYHPLFALVRCAKYFYSGKPLGRVGSISMLYHYLSYRPKETGYDSMFDPEIRKNIRRRQTKRIKRYIKFFKN
jgi:glycosyltransferase involved in cell wall biosynthesis